MMNRRNLYQYGRRNNNNYVYQDPCLTMHQPWASLLVYGIKRIEGRSWPSPITGRLWIHAASKVPDAETIKAMENFYREIYALDGINDLKFPEDYPVSSLVGCVEVVGCLRREELACWRAVPKGVRIEALTKFCWLCEHPQKMAAPLKMRGDQGVYNLQKKISEDAVRDLVPVEGPFLVKFPLPNPEDYYSLRPGSLHSDQLETEDSDAEKSSSLILAVAGAQAAAMQYSKKGHSNPGSVLQGRKMAHEETTDKLKHISIEEGRSTTRTGTITTDSTENKNNSILSKQKQSGSTSVDGSEKRRIGPSLSKGLEDMVQFNLSPDELPTRVQISSRKFEQL